MPFVPHTEADVPAMLAEIGGESRDVIAQPISVSELRDLRYHEWEYTRRLFVEEEGRGEIGYVSVISVDKCQSFGRTQVRRQSNRSRYAASDDIVRHQNKWIARRQHCTATINRQQTQ